MGFCLGKQAGYLMSLSALAFLLYNFPAFKKLMEFRNELFTIPMFFPVFTVALFLIGVAAVIVVENLGEGSWFIQSLTEGLFVGGWFALAAAYAVTADIYKNFKVRLYRLAYPAALFSAASG